MDECFRAVLDAGQSNCNIWYNYIQEGPRSTEVKQHKRALDHQCSFCGKTGGDSLRTCSVCRSVRYCNKACQTADYAGRHKGECKEFAYPPLTSAFITEPYGDRAYPPHPIFASGYETGEVGYWVSIRDQIEVDLQDLLIPLRPKSYASLFERCKLSYEDPETVRKHIVLDKRLLTLEVLVQNRRKDDKPVLVLAAHSRLVGVVGSSEVLLRGKGEVDNIDIFQNTSDPGVFFPSIGVAQDPWTDRPRVLVTNINGKDVPEDSPSKPGEPDTSRGVVALNRGDFAILQMQFRVGHEDTICAYWHVFMFLDSLVMPLLSPWDGRSADLCDKEFTAFFKSGRRPPVGLRARMDPRAIVDYYEDAVKKGPFEFVESHWGTERAVAWCRDRAEGLEKHKEVYRMCIREKGIDELYDCCPPGHLPFVKEIVEGMRANGEL